MLNRFGFLLGPTSTSLMDLLMKWCHISSDAHRSGDWFWSSMRHWLSTERRHASHAKTPAIPEGGGTNTDIRLTISAASHFCLWWTSDRRVLHSWHRKTRQFSVLHPSKKRGLKPSRFTATKRWQSSIGLVIGLVNTGAFTGNPHIEW